MPKPTTVDQATLISMVLGFVQNFLPDFSGAEIIWVRSMKASKFAVFNVQCRSVVSATRVKSTFANLVKSTTKPSYIGDVSISFAHTIGTRVWISLMRAISKRQKEKDPNAVCSVSAFTSRPLLRVGGKDQGTRFLSFVDAIAGFHHLLTQEDRDKALSLCSGLKGRLKSKFLVLSNDRVLPPYQGNRNRNKPQSSGAGPATNHPIGSIQQIPAPFARPAPVVQPQAPGQQVAVQHQNYSQPPPISGFGSNLLPIQQVQSGQNFVQSNLQNTVPGLTMLPLQPGAYLQALLSQAHSQAGLPVAVAEIHADPGRAPFAKVAQKRVRKAADPTSTKRSTPMRKVKGQRDPSSQEPVITNAEHHNKSNNLENFESCEEVSGESMTDVTDAIEVVETI